MITFNNVSKRYGNLDALLRVSFHLDEGELAFLTGHSGAGKSTLLKLASLLERGTSGEVIINGRALNKIGVKQIPFLRRAMGLIFQSPKLLYDRSVFDNVALPLIISGVYRHEVAKRVRAALDLVGLLSKEKMSPIRLSGGEKHTLSFYKRLKVWNSSTF